MTLSDRSVEAKQLLVLKGSRRPPCSYKSLLFGVKGDCTGLLLSLSRSHLKAKLWFSQESTYR